MCLQRMWSISRDKDVPTKIMNRKIVDLQRIQGRVPQRRSLGVLGKDEVASSNLASSSIFQKKPMAAELNCDLIYFKPRSKGFCEIEDFVETG